MHRDLKTRIELAKLKDIVHDIDENTENAIIAIQNVSDVLGGT